MTENNPEREAQACDLDMGVSEAMALAASQLCDLKLKMDRYARRTIGQGFLNDWMGRQGTCAFFGHTFLHLLVPFLNWERSDRPYFKAYVDPRYVLGASIKGYPEDIVDNEISKRIDSYANRFGSIDEVKYSWYKSLGILCAHEGKHRVAFMRAHNAPRIAAWVTEEDYPEPNRLALIAPRRVEEKWLIVLDNRYLQVLYRPQVSLALLQAYGVRIVSWDRQSEWPNEEVVRQEINRRGLDGVPESFRERDRTVDLDELHARMRTAGIPAPMGFFEAARWDWNWRQYLMIAGSCLAIGSVMTLFELPGVRLLGWTGFGVGMGLIAALGIVQFRTPIRNKYED